MSAPDQPSVSAARHALRFIVKPVVVAVTVIEVLAAVMFGGWERILTACALCFVLPINWKHLP